MVKNTVIQAKPIHIKISPYGFHKYAKDYLDIADNLKSGSTYTPVPYFLYCRSIELGLKAYLLAKGETKRYIKNKFIHNLIKGLNRSICKSLEEIIEISSFEKLEIEKANKYYKSDKKMFEYYDFIEHSKMLKDLPDIIILKGFAHKLLKGIKPLVDEKDKK